MKKKPIFETTCRPQPVEWLCLAISSLLVFRYAWLMDDAFVYFRYVDNFLFLKYGFVYNLGEYVEGYSSPFWLLCLTVLRALRMDYGLIILLSGWLALVCFWWLLMYLNRRLRPERVPVVNFPMIYLTLNYAVLCYFTSGLESPLVQLSAPLYALFVLNPGSLILQLCVALSPLVRHELALPLAIVFLWSWVSRRKFPLILASTSVLFTGLWLVFRVYYYADLLPNTFYLKDTIELKQGLIYLHDTLLPYHGYLVWVVFSVVVYLLLKQRKVGGAKGPSEAPCDAPLYLKQRSVMLFTAVAVAAYVVKIGGDPRHYRYLAFPFCLAVCASAGLPEHLLVRVRENRLRWVSLGSLLLILLVLLLYPRQLTTHPLNPHCKHQMVHKINDAIVHRDKATLAISKCGFGWNSEPLPSYRTYAEQGGTYTGVYADSVCVRSYEQFDKRVIQSLGLTEPILARVNMPVDRPAHKQGLKPMAQDIVGMYEWLGNMPVRGMYARAAGAGQMPAWVEHNLESIEVLERKHVNQHNLGENLVLAFTFPDRITPVPSEAEESQ